MGMRQKILVLAWQLIACGVVERSHPKEPTPTQDELIGSVRKAHEQRVLRALELTDPENGWLTPEDGDGWVWSGRFASTGRNTEFNPTATEIEPGRHKRCPQCTCSSKNLSGCWSQDQGIHFLKYALASGNVALLQRHIAYGEAHAENCGQWYTCQWNMGNPSIGFKYSPNLVGMFYSVRKFLTGENHAFARWPPEATYEAGLDDYRANLQMLGIHLREDIEGSLTPAMRYRVEEHSDREAGNPFFWYLRGKYDGNMLPALEACKDGTYGTYVRCGVGLDPERCILAELIFSCDLVLKYLGD